MIRSTGRQVQQQLSQVYQPLYVLSHKRKLPIKNIVSCQNNMTINWTTSERLRGVQVDKKISWSEHVVNATKSFASKPSLLLRMRFLLRKQLIDFYTKVLLPSVTYGFVVLGSCNKTLQQPGKTTRKGRTYCEWITMGHQCRFNTNTVEQFGSNIQSTTDGVRF